MKITEKFPILFLIVLCIVTIGTTSVSAKISAQADKLGYIPGEVIIVLKSEANIPVEIESGNKYELNKKEHLFGNAYKLKFHKNTNMKGLKEWLKGFKEIKSIEFNRIIKQQTIPSEGISNKWGLKKIKAPQA